MSYFGMVRRANQAPRSRYPRALPGLERLEERNLLSPANVQVNAPDTTRQDSQSETSLVVTPNGTIVSAFNNSRVDTNNQHFTGYANSTDGGSTFTDHSPLPGKRGGDAGDPSLAYSLKSNTLYFTALDFNDGTHIQLYRSTDNGTSFHGSGFAATGGSLDKDWLTIDNFKGPAGSGYGNIYCTFTDFGVSGNPVFVTHSTDNGHTFSAPVLIGGTQGGYVVVGPDHSVYAFAFDSSGSPEQIIVRKSTDGGQTFGPTVVVTTLGSTGVNGDLGLGGFRSNSFPHAAVNPVSGNVYLVYNDVGTTSGDRGDIFFRQSTDGGTTWSAAVKVNDDGTTRDQWQPDIAVTPDGTHLFMGWYDRRLDPNNSLINWFGTTGTISGSVVTLAPNSRISGKSFPAVFGQDPVVNSTYMGDYDQAAADNNFFYTTWGDNQNSDAAHRHQPDVFFAKFPVSGIPADVVAGPDLVRAAASASPAPAGDAAPVRTGGNSQELRPVRATNADLVFGLLGATIDQRTSGGRTALPGTHQDYLASIGDGLWNLW